METIKELIECLFSNANYNRIENTDYIIYKHKEYSDFWIIVEDLAINNQKKKYDALKELHSKYTEMDKNTTILVLNDLLSKTALNNDQCIEMENNPLYFKKNVLSYKPEIVSKLIETLEAEKIFDFSKYLFNVDTYEKLEKNNDEISELAYCIAQKLPFIIMDVETQKYECESFYNKLDEEEKKIIDEISSLDIEIIDNEIEHIIAEGLENEI